MATKDRLKDFLSVMKIGRNKFETQLGLANGYVSSKGASISSDVIEKTLDAYPILNAEWLLTGKGSMFKESGSIIGSNQGDGNKIEYRNTGNVELGNNINVTLPESGTQKTIKSDGSVELSSTHPNSVSFKLVPLLNLDAVGGMHSFNEVSDSLEYAEKLIPFTDAQEGDIALVVSGNSMDPTCPSGSKVLLREVQNWNEYFGFGNIFVLLLTDGRRILKEVQKYQDDPKNYVLCKSHNDKYPEEELPKSMISSVWKVVKILNERGW
jgi:phage repressor protein C with HTH and peptisase S24 domain